jgi:hypothetical protein
LTTSLCGGRLPLFQAGVFIMIRSACAATAAVFVALLAAPAPAQDAAPSSPCEIHVWPAPELKAVTQGWVWNHTVNQAFDPAKGGVARPKVLAPAAQAGLLARMDLAGLFGAAPAQLVVHPEPLTRAQASAPTRQTASASPCYSELIVSQVFYDEAPMAGKSLRSLLVHRRFDGSARVQSSFSTWAETELTTFPAKIASEAQAADTELLDAYRSNVYIFARFEQAPRPPPKPKRR